MSAVVIICCWKQWKCHFRPLSWCHPLSWCLPLSWCHPLSRCHPPAPLVPMMLKITFLSFFSFRFLVSSASSSSSMKDAILSTKNDVDILSIPRSSSEFSSELSSASSEDVIVCSVEDRFWVLLLLFFQLSFALLFCLQCVKIEFLLLNIQVFIVLFRTILYARQCYSAEVRDLCSIRRNDYTPQTKRFLLFL